MCVIGLSSGVDRHIDRGMAVFIYRCPNTGFRVQGYTEDETVPRDHDAYERVICLACKVVHLIKPKTGEVLAQDSPPED